MYGTSSTRIEIEISIFKPWMYVTCMMYNGNCYIWKWKVPVGMENAESKNWSTKNRICVNDAGVISVMMGFSGIDILLFSDGTVFWQVQTSGMIFQIISLWIYDLIWHIKFQSRKCHFISSWTVIGSGWSGVWLLLWWRLFSFDPILYPGKPDNYEMAYRRGHPDNEAYWWEMWVWVGQGLI